MHHRFEFVRDASGRGELDDDRLGTGFGEQLCKRRLDEAAIRGALLFQPAVGVDVDEIESIPRDIEG
jgi:hypothetical protein